MYEKGPNLPFRHFFTLFLSVQKVNFDMIVKNNSIVKKFNDVTTILTPLDFT